MNFYLDFEATRFSNRIISIGCVAENGKTFKTYVKPGDKKKVDKFITELTGITNEMLEDAPDANSAFINLYHFIAENTGTEAPTYYVYGNSDADFLATTIRHMTHPLACMCAQAIKGNLINYALVVKKFFVVPSDLALRKVYMLIKSQEELVQKHDALEDALMLQTVVAGLYNKCKPEDKATIMAMPSQKRPQLANRKSAPAIFQKWNKENSSKWEADTSGSEERWGVKCIDNTTQQVKYFDNFNTAALWLIRYVARNVSPKNSEAVLKIETAIKGAIQNNKSRYGCTWEYNPEGAIVATAKEEEDNG